MKECIISNSFLTAVISEQAAEIISLKRKDNGMETVWCRDPAYWFNTNPILFPYTGPLIEGKYEYQGKTYELGQHGFARRARFELMEAKETECLLRLKESEETLKVYPFPFVLEVRYRLQEARILLEYRIVNTGKKDLPFEIGFHPAFYCPLEKDESYDDYSIVFEKEEKLAAPRYDNKIIPDGKRFLCRDYLTDGSFFYRNQQIKSDWVELQSSRHAIRVGIKGFDTVGFWKKTPDFPFICIEPWKPLNGLKKQAFFRPDTEVNLLEAGKEFTCSYWIELRK